MPFILLAVALTWLVCMPLHYRYKKNGRKAISLVFKAIPTCFAAAFAGYAVFSGKGADAYAALIFAGLCVCALADVLLDVRMEAGGALFFCGHVLYVAALSLYKPLSWWSLTLFALSACGLMYFGSHYRHAAPSRLVLCGAAIYGLALAALLGFSIPLPFLAYSRRALLAAAGAALFVVSDLTLCHNTVRNKPVSWHYVSLGIYYTGQLLLGLSAARI